MHREKRRPIVDTLEPRLLMSATYNRTAAVAYATQYAYEVNSDGWFWINGSTETTAYAAGSPVPVNVTNEADGIGDDCAHFVSSCIGTPRGGATGGGLTIPSRTSSYGEPSAGRLDQLLITDGYATQVTSISQLQPGDVIGYDWDGDSGGTNFSDIDHTAIYMGNNVVDAHSTSHSGANWTLGGADYYFFIHITLPSGVPTTPTNTLPANNAFVVKPVTLTAGAFGDTLTGATHTATEWLVDNSSGTAVYDSGTSTSALTSVSVPSADLTVGQTYTWQARYEDNSGNWSSYSTATSFTVTPIGPVVPVNSTPANNSTVTAPTTLVAGAFSDSQTGTVHIASEWVVKNSNNTTVYDSGIDATDQTSVTVPSADLVAGQTYTWQVRYEDNTTLWSAYSSATSFTIAPASLLSLSGPSLYLRNSADGQSLNVWNNTTGTGTPAQTISLLEITKILINGASTDSNITLDFSNGNISPQNRVTVLAAGSSANNVLSILGSNGNDSVSYSGGQFTINGTLVAYSSEGTFGFTPGTGTDTFAISSGTLDLGANMTDTLNLSSLSVASGATLNIGVDTVNLSYTSGNDPESTIESLISSAYSAGLWTGAGINSTMVAANPLNSAIGYVDTGSAITFRPTWKGDANCDGVLNADDLSLMALGQSKQQTDWAAGNFNYDTQINSDDQIIFYYAVAYANGRNYANVMTPGVVLGSATQMSQLLSTPTS